MAMRLALAMGRIDVDGMLSEITPEQFDEWVAYYMLEPFGASWWQSGTVAASAHNAGMMVTAAMGNKKPQFRTPADFVPTEAKPEQKQKKAAERPSWETEYAMYKQLFG